MGTYKGNKGNLMQHWTLCEVLRIAQECGVPALNYIDAHAMAPLATETRWEKHDKEFCKTQAGLPGQNSTYELAWQALAPSPTHGYPNSANIVRRLWQGSLSMLLCEKDTATAKEIERWRSTTLQDHHCEVYCGDWRDRFGQGLPLPVNRDALTLLSFDPYVISKSLKSCATSERCKGNLYPQDFGVIGQALKELNDLKGQVAVQLSTYSANGGNTQEYVRALVDDCLGRYSLRCVAMTRVDGNMMSLVYTHNVNWTPKLEALESRFSEWMAGV